MYDRPDRGLDRDAPSGPPSDRREPSADEICLWTSIERSRFAWYVGFLRPDEGCERKPGYDAALRLLLLAQGAESAVTELPRPVYDRELSDADVEQREQDRRAIVDAATRVAADPSSRCALVWTMAGDRHFRVDVGRGASIDRSVRSLAHDLLADMQLAIGETFGYPGHV